MTAVSDHEMDHRVAVARELTYAAGCPLRDRYGFAASYEHVEAVLAIVFSEPDDAKAGDLIGMANFTGDIQIAMANDIPANEEYEQAIIAALRPLVAQRGGAS